MRTIHVSPIHLLPLAIAAILAAGSAAGCGGGSSQPTPTPTTAGMPGAGSLTTPTVKPTAAITPVPTATPEPARSIAAGYWGMHFRVVSNACGGDPVPGTNFEFEYHFDEIKEPRDGYITDREPVKVTHIGGTYVANLVFSWPQFLFDYPIDGGHAYVTASFDTPHHGTAALTEAYELGNGDTCSIFLRDDG